MKKTHISQEELLLLADGELSSREAECVRSHLLACPGCENRWVELEQKLGSIAEAYKEARPKLWETSGPRALLKARLAEEEVLSSISKRQWLGVALNTRSMAYAGILGLTVLCGVQFAYLHFAHSKTMDEAIAAARPLPDRRFTPGSIRNASLADLCMKDQEETVRQVPDSVQQQVLKEYGIEPGASGKYEIDYLITPGLGGADDVKNLWPEPHANTPWNSFAKDLLEDRLHKMVCEKKIPLEQAQRDISDDWIAAYKKYYQTSALTRHSLHSAS